VTQPGSHRRNIIISALAVALVLIISLLQVPVQANPLPAPMQSPVAFSFAETEVNLDPGGSMLVDATVTNTGSVADTYLITVEGLPAGWTATPSNNSVSLPPAPDPDNSQTITFNIQAPASAVGGSSFTLTGVATGTTSTPPDESRDFLTVNVNEPAIVDVRLAVVGEDEKDGVPGANVNYTIRVVNNGDDVVDVDLRIDLPPNNCDNSITGCLDSVNDSQITLTPGESDDFRVNVLLPADDSFVGTTATTRIVALVDGDVVDTVDVFTTMIAASPTPTETPTPSETPTETPTLAPVCSDVFEDDDDRGSARVIDVNLPQGVNTDPEVDERRAICPAGDEDWLVFGAVQGKVYTIDVRDVEPGLDLTLGLYNEDGERIAFNDDFFNRSPDDPPAEVIDPRIDSWVAPYTGRYYIRVRDAADRGGVDRTYVIELIAESYGPTPQTVVEVCEDLFEPDGLPEQAILITSNEVQEERRLCPTGDADWATFFGREDKTYYIYTDTRPYVSDEPVNTEVDTVAGADTVLVLTDRDGVSVIDVNDDISGGQTLDSQIEFVPEVDGFYYVQVKNVGDIGNQFIVYDLVLELCVGEDVPCGRPINISAQGLSEPLSVATPTFTPTGIVSPDRTSTPTPTYVPGIP
jgi:hypothetical protein